jgi:hypothetical protein
LLACTAHGCHDAYLGSIRRRTSNLNEKFLSLACLIYVRQKSLVEETKMIKKIIGITTILLLLLVIALGVGIGSAKANTSLVQLQHNELRAVDLDQLSNSRSGLLQKSLQLNPVFGVGVQQGLLTTRVRGVLRSSTLLGALRQDLALGLGVHGLDSLVFAV